MQNKYIAIDTLDAYMRNGSITRTLDLNTLHRLPAADVAPVVRCNDCANRTRQIRTDGWVVCGLKNETVRPLHFCAYGYVENGEGGEPNAE